MADTPVFDVLGLGCVAVDELLYVASYPAADAKVEVLDRRRQCGGQTATALVAAARLGARTAYAGTLGDEELSAFAIAQLDEQGVDLSYLRRAAGARPIWAAVIVARNTRTRTIFYDLHGVVGPALDWPPEHVIRHSRVLLVDCLGAEGMIRAARIAREAGVPVVADFETDQAPRFEELLELVDHLIVGRDLARTLTGEADPRTAVRKLPRKPVVVVTAGADGCWFLGPDPPPTPRHLPAFAVEAVDTTGCGDVFHGAYAAALAWGADRELGERLRFASAAAALKAAHCGGQDGIPDRAAVEAFLRARGG